MAHSYTHSKVYFTFYNLYFTYTACHLRSYVRNDWKIHQSKDPWCVWIAVCTPCFGSSISQRQVAVCWSETIPLANSSGGSRDNKTQHHEKLFGDTQIYYPQRPSTSIHWFNHCHAIFKPCLRVFKNGLPLVVCDRLSQFFHSKLV